MVSSDSFSPIKFLSSVGRLRLGVPDKQISAALKTAVPLYAGASAQPYRQPFRPVLKKHTIQTGHQPCGQLVLMAPESAFFFFIDRMHTHDPSPGSGVRVKG